MELEVDLFNHAMKGDWKDVVEIYKDHPEVHEKKITKSGDTALHLAVSDGQEDYVRLLIAIIRDVPAPAPAPAAPSKVENKRAGESPRALRVKNEKGNTPLHLAAALGSFEICYCFASKYPDLIVIRNKEQKNPLFIAAQYGKKDVFLCLDNFLSDMDKRESYYYRGSNGDSFLHAAMNGEYFDLAFQIICRYKDLFNYINEKGLTPLHILASKPSSFKSGSRLSPFDKIIYNCTHVDELKKYDVKAKMEVEKKKENELEQKLKKEMEKDPEKILKPKLKLPENYKTCVDIFGLVRTVVAVLLPRRKNTLELEQTDMENQVPKREDTPPPEQTDMETQVQAYDVFPPNYKTCVNIVKFIYKAVLIILGSGSRGITKVQDKKHQHVYTVQILNKILSNTSQYKYDYYGYFGMQPHVKGMGGTPLHLSEVISESTPPMIPAPQNSSNASEIKQKKEDYETIVLIAAKNGIGEIVEGILNTFPMAIHDVNSKGKNVMHLAVENRQSHIYQFLKHSRHSMEDLFNSVDNDGNNALHLAAMFNPYRFWIVPNAELQMQWEIKWYEYIKESAPRHLLFHQNYEGKTPNEIFLETHRELLKNDKEWLMKTSEQCSIVATLIATAAFSTSTSVPSEFTGNKEKPVLKEMGAFKLFAIPSIVALCTSLTAVAIFLSILTSRYQATDFRLYLPLKLVFGLTALFAAVISMLLSFSSGHFFVIKDIVRHATLVEFIGAFLLPVTCFVLMLFPLYRNVWVAIVKKVPQRVYMVTA